MVLAGPPESAPEKKPARTLASEGRRRSKMRRWDLRESHSSTAWSVDIKITPRILFRLPECWKTEGNRVFTGGYALL